MPNGNETVAVRTEVMSDGTTLDDRDNATKSNSTSEDDLTTEQQMNHAQLKNDGRASEERNTDQDDEVRKVFSCS